MTNPDLLIIGGGPCGMMAGLLFARAGLTVRVVEKHRRLPARFPRRHRASLDHGRPRAAWPARRVPARPHQRLTRAELRIGGREMVVGDLSRVRSATPVRGDDAAMGVPRLPSLRGDAHPASGSTWGSGSTSYSKDGRGRGARLPGETVAVGWSSRPTAAAASCGATAGSGRDLKILDRRLLVRTAQAQRRSGHAADRGGGRPHPRPGRSRQLLAMRLRRSPRAARRRCWRRGIGA
jgi:hypothetical protein